MLALGHPLFKQLRGKGLNCPNF